MNEDEIKSAIDAAVSPLLQEIATLKGRLDRFRITGKYVKGAGDQGISIDIPDEITATAVCNEDSTITITIQRA